MLLALTLPLVLLAAACSLEAAPDPVLVDVDEDLPPDVLELADECVEPVATGPAPIPFGLRLRGLPDDVTDEGVLEQAELALEATRRKVPPGTFSAIRIERTRDGASGEIVYDCRTWFTPAGEPPAPTRAALADQAIARADERRKRRAAKRLQDAQRGGYGPRGKAAE